MRLGLIGNPNVGKSLIFHQLTGLGVEVSNYPGTTVDLTRGNLCFQNERLELVDLPGVYSLDGTSPEEEIVRSFILGEEVEVLVAVLDATHLERNLYLLLQVAEYGKPMVAVLNMMDEAAKKGKEIDAGRLASMLGIEVIPAAAIQGKNIAEIIPAALCRARPPIVQVKYDHHIEAAIRSIQSVKPVTRLQALQALQGLGNDADALELAGALAPEIEEMHRMSVPQIIAGNRHHCAHTISREVILELE
ncbi:MAG TPA: FeoB small GTPase domain-containing protein, partial [Methanolinea sp.]|nr:FeoB small GTPase domain-containing protein [Methanolinea sp.]